MPTPKILLIDYDPVTVEFTRTSLTQAGYDVEVAADGLAGLEAFEALHPDLVVVEAMLPKKHGFEVCQEIKTSDAGRGIPVVITTASYTGRKYRSEALQTYRCDEYLEKPVGKERLLAVCRELLSIDPESSTPIEESSSGESPALERDESQPLPDLTEMSDDELAARLDDLVHEQREEIPLSSGHRVQKVEAEAVEGGSVAEASPETVPELAKVTEEEIVDCLDTALVRSLDKAAGSSETSPKLPDETASERGAASPSTRETPAKPAPIPRKPTTAAPAPKKTAPASRVTPTAPVARDTGKSVTKTRKAPRKPETSKRSETAGEIAAKIAVDRSAAKRTALPAPRPSWIKWAGLAAGVIVLAAAAGAGWYWTRPAATTSPDPAAVPRRNASTARGNSPGLGGSTTNLPDRSAALPVDPAYDPGPIDGLAGRMKQTTTDDVPTGPAEPTSGAPGDRPAARRTAPPEPAPRQSSQVATEPTRTVSAKARGAAAPAVAITNLQAQPAATESQSTVTPKLVVPPPEPTRFEARPLADDSFGSSALRAVSPAPEPVAIPESPLQPGALVDFAQVDIAPRPVKHTMPEYHPQARLKGEQGVVRFELLVDHKGKVEDARLVEGIPGSRLNDAALREARTWTYRPAIKDGVPVKTWVQAQVEFQL